MMTGEHGDPEAGPSDPVGTTEHDHIDPDEVAPSIKKTPSSKTRKHCQLNKSPYYTPFHLPTPPFRAWSHSTMLSSDPEALTPV